MKRRENRQRTSRTSQKNAPNTAARFRSRLAWWLALSIHTHRSLPFVQAHPQQQRAAQCRRTVLPVVLFLVALLFLILLLITPVLPSSVLRSFSCWASQSPLVVAAAAVAAGPDKAQKKTNAQNRHMHSKKRSRQERATQRSPLLNTARAYRSATHVMSHKTTCTVT
jgi:uncharacterized integral membrane protein